MTRQQEGDEAAVMKFCEECGYPIEPVRGKEAGARWRHELPQGYTYAQLEKDHPECFDNPRPSKLPTPEETTLPEMPDFDWKRMEEVAADDLCTPEEHPYHEACAACMAIKGTRWALQMRSKLQALEAERDALKSERDTLEQSRDTWKHVSWENESLRLQYFAELEVLRKERAILVESEKHRRELLEQETPKDAWNRALAAAETECDGRHRFVGELPYTPPLKAGTE